MKTLLRSSLLFALLLLPLAAWAQQATVSGTITDAGSGQPLFGANIRVLTAGTGALVTGAATGVDGRYSLTVDPGTYDFVVTSVGYGEQRRSVTLSAGQRATQDFALQLEGINLDPVVISASRVQEKATDAPASVSVLEAAEIEQQTVAPSSVQALRNTVGVDIAQTGIDRFEVVTRGFNNAFSGAAYVLTDYRQGAIASLGVNAYNMMPIQSLDLERIEVVRGPGSALYGAGVDAGVIHFFTKSPFAYPGVSVSVMGGNQSLFQTQFRAATVINENLGVKVTGMYGRAEDWAFDPDDEEDARQIATYFSTRPRQDDVSKYNVNGMVEYRFNPNMSLTANGGFSSSNSVFLSGIGTLQSDGFGYTYGQLRFNAGGFFAQAYVNKNNAGDSFVYASSAASLSGQQIIDNSLLFNVQVQQEFSLMDRFQFVVGADYEQTTPDTEGTIYGRNEDDDTITEYGAYAQAQTNVNDMFQITVAARADYNNIVDDVRISPRAALVFKPVPGHSLRATFNQAFSSPGSNSNFLDIVAAECPIPGMPGTPLVFRARGAYQGLTFKRNPAFGGINNNLVTAYLIPAAFGTEGPAGLPLGFVYQGVYNAINAMPNAQLQAMLAAQGIQLSEQEIIALKGQLAPGTTNVGGVSVGQLAIPNLSTGEFRPVSDAVDIDPLKQTTTETYELGYRGLFGGKLLFAIDGYYTHKENFIGPLLVESPFVLVGNSLGGDFAAAVAAGIQGNAMLNGFIQSKGLNAQQVAAIIAALAAPSLPAAGTPIGVVQVEGNEGTAGQTVNGLLAYRNFGQLDYWGVDVNVQYLAMDNLVFFGNLSYTSDDFFDNEELDEANTSLSLALNAPKTRVRGGFDYRPPQGLSFNAAVRYSDGFPVRSGPYEGEVDSYMTVDAGVGYDFSRYVAGLRADVAVQNLLGDEHREFIGAPKIGRLVTARLTYDIW